MKTEDDTFRVLTQKPYKYVKDELDRAITIGGKRAHKLINDKRKMEKFLLSYGWTIDEFSRRLFQE